jgi:hypothetical protein
LAYQEKMARNRSAKARRESKRKQKQYVLEHQRQLAEEERKKYLLTLDLESNQVQLRSLEHTSGPRIGSIMRRLIASALPNVGAGEIKFYRFGNLAGVDGTSLTDDVDIIEQYNREGVYKRYLAALFAEV